MQWQLSEVRQRSETPKRGVGRPCKADGSAGQSSEDQWVTVNAEDPDGMHALHQHASLCTLHARNSQLPTVSIVLDGRQLLNARIKGGIVHIKDGRRIVKLTSWGGKWPKPREKGESNYCNIHTLCMYSKERLTPSRSSERKQRRSRPCRRNVTWPRLWLYEARRKSQGSPEMDTLSSACAVEPNHGRMYEDVSPRHARRKLNAFTKQAQDALWFSGTFGLVPECLQVRKAKLGSPIKVPLGPQTTAASNGTQLKLSEDDQTKVLQTLYIVDQFAVSDEAYHELRKLSCDLPPLYQLKKKRAAILQIERIPTMGAHRPFRETQWSSRKQ